MFLKILLDGFLFCQKIHYVGRAKIPILMFKKKKKQIEIKHTCMSLEIAHITDSFFLML